MLPITIDLIALIFRNACAEGKAGTIGSQQVQLENFVLCDWCSLLGQKNRKTILAKNVTGNLLEGTIGIEEGPPPSK